MRYLFFFVLILNLTGCKEIQEEIAKKEPPYYCLAMGASHQVTVDIYSHLTIPNKLAISINGDLKYDECSVQTVAPTQEPFLYVEKRSQHIRVKGHYYGSPDEKLTIEVLGRQDCVLGSTPFFQVSEHPMQYKWNIKEPTSGCTPRYLYAEELFVI